MYQFMDSPPDDYLEHEVVHCSQQFNWDCGTACVLMLLEPEQRQHFRENLEAICTEEGFGRITWTIDLCYLLKRFGIKHTMHSTTLGVNENHRNHSYYRHILGIDTAARITQRFDAAEAAGLELTLGQLSTADIAEHLRRGPAIVLVDAGLLACDLCKHNKLKVDFRRCFGGQFTGHFILVVGLSRGKLLYRDPALAPRLCAVSPARLQRARPPPTDHDVVLIHKDYRRTD